MFKIFSYLDSYRGFVAFLIPEGHCFYRHTYCILINNNTSDLAEMIWHFLGGTKVGW